MLHNGGQEMRGGGPSPRKSCGLELTGNELSAAAKGRLEKTQFIAANGRSGSDARMVPPS